jgi:hypothetical protein
MSEAYSYHRLATALHLLPYDPSHALPFDVRAVTEEYALDSYENLLFSIARFHEVTSRWPARITVVGYGMKKRRFTDLHRAAIGWDEDKWDYVGIDDEGDTTSQYEGELKYGYTPFLGIPSGCAGSLGEKRLQRNPFAKYHPYHVSCPELVGLLEWCPAPREVQGEDAAQMEVYKGELPWRDATWEYKPDRLT